MHNHKYKEYSCNFYKCVGHLAYNCRKKGDRTNYLSEKGNGRDVSDDDLADNFNKLFYIKNFSLLTLVKFIFNYL